jgi:polysaccharide biosynthesis/export protein
MTNQVWPVVELPRMILQWVRDVWLLSFTFGAVVCGAQQPPLAQGSSADATRSFSDSEASLSATALPTAGWTGSYAINPEDILDIYVYDVPELSREYTVNDDGTVTVPLLPKPARAAGLSPDQFARSLEENFRQSGRLTRPQIMVSVKQSRRSVVIVEGAVKLPQAVPVMGRTRLLSVLNQCGGRSEDAGATVTVTRGEPALRDLANEATPPSAIAKVDLRKLTNPDDPTSRFEVWPGDRVRVERAGVFYVLGEVARPGGYNLLSADEQVSVLQALALAGDTTRIAKVDKTVLIRKDPKAPNGRVEIPLNLKAMLDGRSADRVLQASDILYVPVSGGKRALRSAGAVAAATATAAGAAAVYSRF